MGVQRDVLGLVSVSFVLGANKECSGAVGVGIGKKC